MNKITGDLVITLFALNEVEYSYLQWLSFDDIIIFSHHFKKLVNLSLIEMATDIEVLTSQ